jgi:hypothetical protein
MMEDKVKAYFKIRDEISYKVLLKLFYGLSILLTYLIYHFSIAPTIEKYFELIEKNTQIINTNDLPSKLKAIKIDIEQLDLLIGEGDQVDKLGKRRALLGAISDYCNTNHITIKQISKPEYFEQNQVFVEINQLVLKGSFFELLKFIYYMEERKSFGRIASLSYFMEKDVKTKEESLSLLVYFQYLIDK